MGQTAIFAGGCFWCIEALFNEIAGVISVESGYIGGHIADPSYEQVCAGESGHAEAVRIVFDDQIISYLDLLEIFFASHDPTLVTSVAAAAIAEGEDEDDHIGTEYRSAIFPLDDQQREQAVRAIKLMSEQLGIPLATSIEGPAIWYPAEKYHQQYWSKVGTDSAFCAVVIPPKLKKLRSQFADKLKITENL